MSVGTAEFEFYFFSFACITATVLLFYTNHKLERHYKKISKRMISIEHKFRHITPSVENCYSTHCKMMNKMLSGCCNETKET